MIKFLSRGLIALLVLTGSGFNASALKTEFVSHHSSEKSLSVETTSEARFQFKAYSSADKEPFEFIAEETVEEDKNELTKTTGPSNEEPSYHQLRVDFELHGLEESKTKLKNRPYLNIGLQKTYLLFEVFRL
jgi:hypothetical protein